MSRTLRIEYPGAVYHVQSEGNRGDAIYLDDEDREIFLRTFQEASRRSGWTVYAYALMANHYHILFQTARANLVDGMKWLQTAYTQRFNARHRMRGHLFAGRYHAMVVEADNAHYFSTIIDYIHLNPARSGPGAPPYVPFRLQMDEPARMAGLSRQKTQMDSSGTRPRLLRLRRHGGRTPKVPQPSDGPL